VLRRPFSSVNGIKPLLTIPRHEHQPHAFERAGRLGRDDLETKIKPRAFSPIVLRSNTKPKLRRLGKCHEEKKEQTNSY
jgi:hypothetical protein